MEFSKIKKGENKKNNDKFIITYSNSIEFINQIENIYINGKSFEKEQKYKLNNNNSPKSNESIKVINYMPKTSLSSLIFKKGIIITCMTIKLNNIYIGTNKGEIRVYNWKTEKKLNYLINSDISRESKKDVICMDASYDNKVLVVGHLNGYILLWDVQTAECKKLIQNEFNSQIIAIKFSLIDENFYEFLASDLKGSVKRLGVNEGFFFNSVNSNGVIDYTQAIFIIEVLQLTKEQKKMIYRFNNNDDIEEPLIVAFGALDFVFIVQLEPESKRLYNFKKPSFIRSSFIPDICFGLGRIPAPFFYSQDISLEDIKNIKKEDLNLNIKSNIDINKNHQLILVSWGKIIYIFMISFDLDDFLSIYLIGNYINNEPIIRIGFLSNNIIYILNLYKKFKILNTGFMNPGEIKIDSEGTIITNNKSKPELCSEFGLDYEILFQTYIPDALSKSKNAYKSTYNNLVTSHDKNIFAVCKKNIYVGCLLNWEQCINELFKNSEWLEAFQLGIDIYHGDNRVLEGIPLSIKERKDNIKSTLKGLILQLIISTINIKGIFYNEKKSEEILSQCINISIELCIDVNEIDFLLKEILPKLEEKGYFSFFIQKIKPFILEKKIKNDQLGQNLTSKILKYYFDQSDYISLSQIIININLEFFDIKEIKDICKSKNIIEPLIYIYYKSNQEDLFLLIVKIYDLYKKANNISKEKYEKYKNDIIYHHKIDNKKINEFHLTKQYIGQKLLWVINLCLKGKENHTGLIINDKIYIKLISKIFLWLIKDEILNELLIFDSFTFFLILSGFFTKDKSIINEIKKIKIKDEESKKLLEGIIYKGKNIEKIDIQIIIEIILNKVKSINKVLINDDFNEFILKINSLKQILEKKYIIDSINYFINFQNKKEEREKEQKQDFFEYHYNNLDDNSKKEKYSLDINKVLENYKNKIEKKEFNEMLMIANNNKYPLVCIKILQILNENIKCLDVYIDSNNKIKNKEDKIFEFINNFMNICGKNEQKIYKKELLERVGKLAEFSIEKLFNMILKWMNEEHLSVIEKLNENSELKLKYIELLINYYEENIIIEKSNKKNIKESDYKKLLNMHIETLCKKEKKKSIINLLKGNKAYLNEDCLKICLKNSVLDASIYIYFKQEKYQEAINLCKKEISSNIDNLIKVFTEENNESKNKLFLEHDEIINKFCYICEKESEQLPAKDKKKIWLEILDFLYKRIELINLKEKKMKKNLKEIIAKISEDINNFILKMYPHVNMKSIIDEIYKKTKMSDFKGFNNIINRFVKEQIEYINIFNKMKSIIDYSIDNNFREKNKSNMKGISYKFDKCDYCHKNFKEKDNENILLFRCGHNAHKNENCIKIINNVYICKICYNKEAKVSIGSFWEEKIITDSNYNNSSKNKENEIKNKNINNYNDNNNISKDLKNKFNKINFINDKINNKNSKFSLDMEDIDYEKTMEKKK